MASDVTAKVMGGEAKTGLSISTVKEAFEALELSGNYTATVLGKPASMEDSLEDGSFVSFSTAVKGGN